MTNLLWSEKNCRKVPEGRTISLEGENQLTMITGWAPQCPTCTMTSRERQKMYAVVKWIRNGENERLE